jgi:ribokinase
VITLGAAGAVLATADRREAFAPVPVEAVDATAAGDAFTGTLGAALAGGMDLDEAIRHGMAAGALAVTKAGASPSLPMAAEIRDLLTAHPA